ncbi:MAG: TIGR03862 family flavoprotein [Chloroflexota bacterium]
MRLSASKSVAKSVAKSAAKSAAVIGGGPAGLMAAEVLSDGGLRVDLYDAMPAVGRKFLVAGSSGLNLTHAGPLDEFLSHYGTRRAQLEPFVRAFGPDELRRWASELGSATFIGTSGRVFPDEMKAANLLHAWRERLGVAGVTFHPNHKWIGWTDDGSLRFETPDGETPRRFDALVLALGGASWPQTGSTGAWAGILAGRGIPVTPFKPANCGFDVNWSEHFRQRFEGQPLKSVVLEFEDFRRQGEFVVTAYGVEGSLVYAVSAQVRDALEGRDQAIVRLDLTPDRTREWLVERLSRPRGSRSMSSHLKKTVGIQGVRAGLLWEFVPREDFADAEKLAAAIKSLPLPLVAPRPLEEAISTAGGIPFEALDERLMLTALPGVFCAGEMLDWEAPTGGYLLTACFATGRAAGLGALEWLRKQ